MIAILVYGFIAAGAEVLGSSLVFMRKSWPAKVQEYLLALSAGFLLALVFIELLPESIETLGHEAGLYALAGYAVLHFFEHTLVGHLHFGEETHHDLMVSPLASFSTFLGLLVHAFFDGFTIAVGMQFDFTLGFFVFVAVLLHKIPEGLTIATVMQAARQSRKRAWIASLAVGGSTFLGVVAGLILTTASDKVMGIAFAFSAGIAAYVGASDLIPEINRSRNRVIPVMVFVGILLFYAGTLIVHGVVDGR